MKPIQKDELFLNLSEFLKTKGIELQEGSYTQKIRKSCTLMADAINLSQQGIERAKTGIDRKLDKMRQVIHEKTAPKPPASAASGAQPTSDPGSSAGPAPGPAAQSAGPAADAPPTAAKKRPARAKKRSHGEKSSGPA